MKRIIIIDNYDSFTYNLVQAVAVIEQVEWVKVFRNDQITPADLAPFQPSHLIISPGPCTPAQAGDSNDIIRYWQGQIPILGVCLGHQCIAEVLGGKIIRAPKCMHGKTSLVQHDGQTIFTGLPNPFKAMRYHSLIAEFTNLPADVEISAQTDTGEIMALRNRQLKLEGVQFHPESFATKVGPKLVRNFLDLS